MKFKNQDDNRYRVRFMVATEELIDKLTVKEFISYLEENAELEDEEHEYIDGKVVLRKAYDLKEADSNLHKEFLVTEDGRVFYWLSLWKKVELVDGEEKVKDLDVNNSRWYVVIGDEMYGATAYRTIYVPGGRDVDYIKCLKKLFKRINKQYEKAGLYDASIYAYMENEDGEVKRMDMFWFYEETEHRELKL